MTRRPALPVLIVDDDIDHAVIMRTVLSTVAPEADVSVVTAVSAVEHRVLAAPEKAIVLVDRILCAEETFPLVAAVTAARPDLTVVMLSAALDEVSRTHALECGAAMGAEKPDSFAGWRLLLGEILAEASRRGSRERAVA
jgi:DNA-binding NtrC family response regulator